jgi:hypothetical protein
MKKVIFFTIVMIFTLSSAMAFANNTANTDANKSAIPAKTENKLSDEEISRLTKRVEEIRDMDKSEMNAKEKKELRKELKTIKKNVEKSGGTVYIGGATLILLIILIILLV